MYMIELRTLPMYYAYYSHLRKVSIYTVGALEGVTNFRMQYALYSTVQYSTVL